jgi:hypothetical protein
MNPNHRHLTRALYAFLVTLALLAFGGAQRYGVRWPDRIVRGALLMIPLGLLVSVVIAWVADRSQRRWPFPVLCVAHFAAFVVLVFGLLFAVRIFLP